MADNQEISVLKGQGPWYKFQLILYIMLLSEKDQPNVLLTQFSEDTVQTIQRTGGKESKVFSQVCPADMPLVHFLEMPKYLLKLYLLTF